MAVFCDAGRRWRKLQYFPPRRKGTHRKEPIKESLFLHHERNAGSFVAMDSVVASPAAVAGSRERPRGRATQTALSVASTATQCALQFFSTAECQTEADCAVHVPGCVPAGAPLEALLPPPPPPAQHGVGPSCSWHSGNPGWVRLPLDRKSVQTDHRRQRRRSVCACAFAANWTPSILSCACPVPWLSLARRPPHRPDLLRRLRTHHSSTLSILASLISSLNSVYSQNEIYESNLVKT
ncbi:uncharacterized protein LOC144142351 isoform X5 [Haemaphysalis longicornis]